jgi:metal-responsive CopG/Arc/MetJ family transcriptional regulator
MDEVIGAGIAANRSELLRMAVRRYVDAELKREAAEAERRKGGA